jgi:large subunit ribosomal protein L13
VRGMLPRTSLGRTQLNKLKVYTTPDHPHDNFQPKPLPAFAN